MVGSNILSYAAAATSNTSSPSFNIPTTTIRLSRDNFCLWRSTIISTLEAFNLQSHILAPKPPAETRLIVGEDGAASSEPNPEFIDWRRSDRLVLLWLKSTLTESVLATVARSTSAHMAWVVISKTFQAQTKAQRMTLKTQLQSLTKGSLSIMEYVEKKRSIADSLAENLHPVSDEDLIGHILAGLDSSYGSFISAFMLKSEEQTVDDLVGHLLREEAHIEREQNRASALLPTPTTQPSSMAAAFAVHKYPSRQFSSPKPHSPHPQFSDVTHRPFSHSRRFGSRLSPLSPSGQGTSSRRLRDFNTPRVICQLCGQGFHSAIDCWHRGNQADYPSRRQPPRDTPRQAHVAQHGSSSTVIDPAWYFDTGATDHVTPDFSKLTVAEDYTGTDKLQVGNEFTGSNSSPRRH
ncbi:Retrovirus-related Pol polyprotein from transposon RE1 [Linum perenne]